MSPPFRSTREQETRVRLDEIRDVLLESQVAVSKFWNPMLGWALLTLVALDLALGALGIPVLGGLIVASFLRDGVADAWALSVAAVLQVGLLSLAAYLLYHSPWHVWPGFLRRPGVGERTDRVAAIGIATGLVIAALFAFLGGVATESTTSLLRATWLRDGPRAIAAFQLAQIVLLAAPLLFVFVALPRTQANFSKVYRLVAPSRTGSTVYRLSLASATLHPSYAVVDPTDLPKALVLQRSEHGYRLLNAAEPIPLVESDCVIIDLLGLQRRVGADSFRIVESAEIFQAEARYITESLSLASRPSLLGEHIPAPAVEWILQAFFENENIRSRLDHVLASALADYATIDGAPRPASDLRDQCLGQLAAGRDALMQALARCGDRPSSSALGRIGAQPYLAAQAELERVIEDWTGIWSEYRRRTTAAEQELPRLFRARLLSSFLEDATGVEGLGAQELTSWFEVFVDCSGIGIAVESFGFAPGAAGECENAVLNAQLSLDQYRLKIEEDLRSRDREIHMAAHQQVHELRLDIIAKLERLIPYLRPRGPEHIINLAERLLRMGAEDQQQLLALIESASPTAREAILERAVEEPPVTNGSDSPEGY